MNIEMEGGESLLTIEGIRKIVEEAISDTKWDELSSSEQQQQQQQIEYQPQRTIQWKEGNEREEIQELLAHISDLEAANMEFEENNKAVREMAIGYKEALENERESHERTREILRETSVANKHLKAAIAYMANGEINKEITGGQAATVTMRTPIRKPPMDIHELAPSMTGASTCSERYMAAHEKVVAMMTIEKDVHGNELTESKKQIYRELSDRAKLEKMMPTYGYREGSSTQVITPPVMEYKEPTRNNVMKWVEDYNRYTLLVSETQGVRARLAAQCMGSKMRDFYYAECATREETINMPNHEWLRHLLVFYHPKDQEEVIVLLVSAAMQQTSIDSATNIATYGRKFSERVESIVTTMRPIASAIEKIFIEGIYPKHLRDAKKFQSKPTLAQLIEGFRAKAADNERTVKRSIGLEKAKEMSLKQGKEEWKTQSKGRRGDDPLEKKKEPQLRNRVGNICFEWKHKGSCSFPGACRYEHPQASAKKQIETVATMKTDGKEQRPITCKCPVNSK